MKDYKQNKEKQDHKKNISSFLKDFKVDETEILAQVKYERSIGDDYYKGERDEIESDLILLRNQKKNKDMIGDTTLFNVHTALVARSFQGKSPIKFRGDKNGIEREVKMLNSVWEEDNATPQMRALRYYQAFDKYATGVSVTVKTGWDGVNKQNKFEVINPLLVVPDPNGDYFSNDYRFVGFSFIKDEEELKREGYDIEEMTQGASTQGAINQRIQSQADQGIANISDDGLYELYLHFTHIDDVKVRVLTGSNEQIILDAGKVPAGNKKQEKDPESIQFPLSFKFWKPLRDKFAGDRPANYCRDVQIQKAIIANLRLDKMRAELYPMYLYNKDYVNGKDLSFGFNKGIPISTGIANPGVNLGNLVQPIQKDLRIDTSMQIDQLMDRQVEKSTSIGEVVQGTTPNKRETLGTNQLIVSNTDINLALNDELDLIGEEQMVYIWFAGYYENFESGDKKLIFAGMGTSQIPIQLKRKDFIYEGNLAISTESNAQTEQRKRKLALAYQMTAPLILQDMTINEGSKRATLRRIAEANGIDDEDIDVEIPKTSQQRMQALENDLLNDGEYIEINPDDDHEQHLIEMGSLILTPEAEMHQYAHIQASIEQGQQQQQPQDAGMLASMSNVASNQASQEQAQAI